MNIQQTSVNIACWNINCLRSKLLDKSSDPLFLKEISNFDIACLSELKCNMANINFEGYKTHIIQRRGACKGRFFGGIAILVKQNIRRGIKFMTSTSSEYQWFKLDRTFFGLKRHIYVCFTYYSPRNSSYNSDVDILDSISKEMTKYSLDGDILLCGDFNARTGNMGQTLLVMMMSNMFLSQKIICKTKR